MKEQTRIADLFKNVNFEGFLLVKNAQQKTSMNGSKYLDLTLTDTSGDIFLFQNEYLQIVHRKIISRRRADHAAADDGHIIHGTVPPIVYGMRSMRFGKS